MYQLFKKFHVYSLNDTCPVPSALVAPVSQLDFSGPGGSTHRLHTNKSGRRYISDKEKSYNSTAEIIKLYENLTEKYDLAHPIQPLLAARNKLWPKSGIQMRKKKMEKFENSLARKRSRQLRDLYQRYQQDNSKTSPKKSSSRIKMSQKAAEQLNKNGKNSKSK